VGESEGNNLPPLKLQELQTHRKLEELEGEACGEG